MNTHYKKQIKKFKDELKQYVKTSNQYKAYVNCIYEIRKEKINDDKNDYVETTDKFTFCNGHMFDEDFEMIEAYLLLLWEPEIDGPFLNMDIDKLITRIEKEETKIYQELKKKGQENTYYLNGKRLVSEKYIEKEKINLEKRIQFNIDLQQGKNVVDDTDIDIVEDLDDWVNSKTYEVRLNEKTKDAIRQSYYELIEEYKSEDILFKNFLTYPKYVL